MLSCGKAIFENSDCYKYFCTQYHSIDAPSINILQAVLGSIKGVFFARSRAGSLSVVGSRVIAFFYLCVGKYSVWLALCSYHK